MAEAYLIRNITVVNEASIYCGNIFVNGNKIVKVSSGEIILPDNFSKVEIIEGKGKFLLPGIIDGHVHFREPGLTHKGDIFSESRAAVAGGVTSYMEMPNTIPQATTNELLMEKFRIASGRSYANFSFYLGATNDNIHEILRTDKKHVCGIKLFLGSSTGNMLVDNENLLSKIFSEAEILIAAHCEDENIIKKNLTKYSELAGNKLDVSYHPLIRSEEACFRSTEYAVRLAGKYNTRLHIAHLTTEKELELLSNAPSDGNKRITAEACLPHLWFSTDDYKTLGNLIKVNPAIKTETDRMALIRALSGNKIDTVATDHAPHLLEEKMKDYLHAPSGTPMVQHSLALMIELHLNGLISLETIVEKMCHAPARIFGLENRGFIREGYAADLVIIDLNNENQLNKESILYKCGWSAVEGLTVSSKVLMTFVNGKLAYNNGAFSENTPGEALIFNR